MTEPTDTTKPVTPVIFTDDMPTINMTPGELLADDSIKDASQDKEQQ